MARVPTALNAQTFKLSISLSVFQTLTNTHSQGFWKKKEKQKKKKLSLSLTSAAEDSRRRQLLVSSAAALSLIGGSSRRQRLSPFTPIHGTLFLSLSLSRSLNAVVWSSLLLFVLLITNGCNFMKKKIPLKAGVCKFCIFMHKLILGFHPGIN